VDSGPARSADFDATILGGPRFEAPGPAEERVRRNARERGSARLAMDWAARL